MKLTSHTLYSQAKAAILDIIHRQSDFMYKLPSEQELSKMLDVSRNTVREALKSMENEGILISRQGVGTFVIRDSRSIQHNIAILNSTTKIIASQGYEPGTRDVLHGRRALRDPEIVKKLGGQGEDLDILYVERVRTADEKPVAFVEDYIPYVDGMLERFDPRNPLPLFDFLKSFDRTVSFSDCTIHSVLSDGKLKDRLTLSSPQALLLLRQTHYTAKGAPVLYSDSYFLSEKLEFSIIRKCVS